jgi:hypothetical protein
MKTARVVANPYAAIDANGVPQGVVGVPGTRGIYVGARIDTVASVVLLEMRKSVMFDCSTDTW